MPSGRTRPQPEPDLPLVFFLDRGLGRHLVAGALRAAGQTMLTMAEVYPGGDDERIPDDEWIVRAAQEDWVVLTKDYNIIRDHSEVLARTDLRVFAFNSARLTGDAMAKRVLAQLNRILQRARKRGPYVDAITADGLERRWPSPKS